MATDILPMQRYGDARVRENWNTGLKEKEISLLPSARLGRCIPFGDIVRFSHLWMTKIS
ncbi:MAG: hypothetical protein WAP04_05890 [Bacillota bacterium]